MCRSSEILKSTFCSALFQHGDTDWGQLVMEGSVVKSRSRDQLRLLSKAPTFWINGLMRASLVEKIELALQVGCC